MEGNRRLYLGDITNLYNTGLDSPTGTSNVRKTLHRELSMSSCHARPKPFLKATHRAKRLAWAHEVEGWTMKEWENVIWTDESQE